MSKAIKYSSVLKDDMVLIISLCLFFYFSFHLLFGDRSYLALIELGNEKTELEFQLEERNTKISEVENEVMMLRPSSLDRDFLEERVQLILGYGHSSDNIVFDN